MCQEVNDDIAHRTQRFSFISQKNIFVYVYNIYNIYISHWLNLCYGVLL